MKARQHLSVIFAQYNASDGRTARTKIRSVLGYIEGGRVNATMLRHRDEEVAITD